LAVCAKQTFRFSFFLSLFRSPTFPILYVLYLSRRRRRRRRCCCYWVSVCRSRRPTATNQWRIRASYLPCRSIQFETSESGRFGTHNCRLPYSIRKRARWAA
jgi:hypothetical protein